MVKNENQLLKEFNTPFNAAPFDRIQTEDYLPAFIEIIKKEEEEIERITSNPEPASFKNTIVALEKAGKSLNRAANIFFNLCSAETSPLMQDAAQQISPLLVEHSGKITLNKELFERIHWIYSHKDQLDTAEEKMLVRDYYMDFIRNGANLNEEKKKRFIEIKTRLSALSLSFDDHVLADTNNFTLQLTDQDDLAGLPQYVIDAAALEAKKQNKTGWIFTLHIPSYLPFMQFSEKRALREKIYRAYTSKGNRGNENDNKEIVREIINLRLELAQLMNCRSYSEYVLKERMAETPGKVNQFLQQLHLASHPFANKEFDELTTFASNRGADFKIQRWDWPYYSEKLKEERFGFNDEMVKPYFELSRVIKGIFNLATKLYGITFKEIHHIPVYHPDVKTFEVADENKQFLALLYLDFFPREGKKGGAWMTEFLEQSSIEGTEIRPHISLVTNFTKPTETTPSLLTFNEVTTFLHEFGHALHGMLSRCTYPSISGTSVYRDFVELPSQFMENFAIQKEWLDEIAIHYQTGEKMPEELIHKIIGSNNFHAGYASERQLCFGMTDMAWHSIQTPYTGDILNFETKVASSTELFDAVKGSALSTAFSHIFAGGYAAGYYGYKWAEVLDADAFSVFKKNGIFDQKTATSFRKNILEKGGTEHPMTLYVKFRGQEPSINALLERSGLK